MISSLMHWLRMCCFISTYLWTAQFFFLLFILFHSIVIGKDTLYDFNLLKLVKIYFMA